MEKLWLCGYVILEEIREEMKKPWWGNERILKKNIYPRAQVDRGSSSCVSVYVNIIFSYKEGNKMMKM